MWTNSFTQESFVHLYLRNADRKILFVDSKEDDLDRGM